MKEYRYPNYLKAIGVLFSFVLFGGSIGLFYFGLTENKSDSEAIIILSCFSLVIFVFSIFLLLENLKGKFTIFEDRVAINSSFNSRELFLDEIKGFRNNEHYIIIEPKGKGKKAIKISTYLSGKKEVLNWLSERYPNLDFEEVVQEEAQFLENSKFGQTENERIQKLESIKKQVKVLNFTGGGFLLWGLFYPYPYEIPLIGSFLAFCIGLFLYRKNEGLIKLDAKKESVHPNTSISLFAACGLFMLRSLFDFSILEYENIWLPSIGFAAVMSFALFFRNREFSELSKSKVVIGLFIPVCFFGFGYGSVVFINCYFDSSFPERYRTEILEKRISSGKNTTYYLQLNPSGPENQIEEVSVSEDFYNQVTEGMPVTIYSRPGLLSVPWYEVGY